MEKSRDFFQCKNMYHHMVFSSKNRNDPLRPHIITGLTHLFWPKKRKSGGPVLFFSLTY